MFGELELFILLSFESVEESSALKIVSNMLIERINKQMINIDEMKTKGGAKNVVT